MKDKYFINRVNELLCLNDKGELSDGKTIIKLMRMNVKYINDKLEIMISKDREKR